MKATKRVSKLLFDEIQSRYDMRHVFFPDTDEEDIELKDGYIQNVTVRTPVHGKSRTVRNSRMDAFQALFEGIIECNMSVDGLINMLENEMQEIYDLDFVSNLGMFLKDIVSDDTSAIEEAFAKGVCIPYDFKELRNYYSLSDDLYMMVVSSLKDIIYAEKKITVNPMFLFVLENLCTKIDVEIDFRDDLHCTTYAWEHCNPKKPIKILDTINDWFNISTLADVASWVVNIALVIILVLALGIVVSAGGFMDIRLLYCLFACIPCAMYYTICGIASLYMDHYLDSLRKELPTLGLKWFLSHNTF